MRRFEFSRLAAPAVLSALALSGCVATPPPGTATAPTTPTQRPRPASPPPMTIPSPPPSAQPGAFIPPRVMNLPGLEGVIGSNASALAALFGPPRLQVREGDALKLQFTGEPCVLDVYLYPLTQGAEPSATYVDARRASDGLDVDRAACVAALRR
ncbi:MAG: hypothetical protein MK010_00545 [Erythrobacter sp.]|nr:hypothetical protein [Erythrobacter sp.]